MEENFKKSDDYGNSVYIKEDHISEIKQNKNLIEPNCCSIWRWIIVIVISLLAMQLFSLAAVFIQKVIPAGTTAETLHPFISNMVVFGLTFWAAVFAMKWISKTPFKDFVFGLRGKLNIKNLCIIGGLYLVGAAVASLIFDTWELNTGVKPSVIVISVIIALIFTWMQTSMEEIWFRGILIRFLGKGECKLSTKFVIGGIVLSLLFMVAHIPNSEVQSQSGVINLILCLSTYFLSGFLMFILDLMYGDLTPGLVIHAVNNMWCFIVVSAANSTGGSATIFISSSNASGASDFLTILICYLPVMIYTLILGAKKMLNVNCDGK